MYETSLEQNLTPICPVKPVLPYMGGKFRLHKTIIPRISAVSHKIYCEPFVGMGGIFLRRDKKPSIEVINDLSGDVVNLFRVLRRHYPQFKDYLKFEILSREEFERMKACDPTTLTDFERAERFICLQRATYGGKVTGRTYRAELHYKNRIGSRFDALFEAVHKRLSEVNIENLPWAECIRKYDNPHTLFYLDPPYWGFEDIYGKNMFDRGEFEKMAALLADLKGRFIMSINDVPEIRAIFARFAMEEVSVKYDLSPGIKPLSKELIISGGRAQHV